LGLTLYAEELLVTFRAVNCGLDQRADDPGVFTVLPVDETLSSNSFVQQQLMCPLMMGQQGPKHVGVSCGFFKILL
jgi:hypothetical protein